MNLDMVPSRDFRFRLRVYTLTSSQVISSSLLFAFGTLLLGTSVDIALANTWLIFILVTVSGLWFCHHTRISLNDSKLKILGSFWLIKVAATLALLYAGWIPQLDPSSSESWGYDAQRYYYDARQLIKDDWNPIVGNNYQGIIFYYAGIFFLFGHNPVIPAMINSFVTLMGTLFLIRCAYTFTAERTKKDWTIALLLLVPEVLWYDVMTSRESLMAVLIIIAALAVGKNLIDIGRNSLLKTLVLSGAAFLAILAVRTSMAIPLAVSIVTMALLVSSQRKMGAVIKITFVALGVAAISAGPLIQQLTGGYDIDYVKTFERIQSFEHNVAAKEEWDAKSFGLLFAPTNVIEFLLFVPPRMLMYLAAPLPNVDISIMELWSGSWGDWQRLMTITTSAMMLIGFPYVLASSSMAWRSRKRIPGAMIIPINFWIMFAAVAGGNIIIHERYRIMFTLLLFACVWWGFTRCSSKELQRWSLRWYIILFLGLILYIVYKYFV